MRRTEIALASIASSAPIVVDRDRNPVNIAFGVDITGTVNYTVEHTFDDIFAVGFSAGAAKWFPHPTVAGATADADGTYAFPVMAIRITINSGAGSLRFMVLQAGHARG